MLPELPQKLPSWAQNAHLAAIMPHLGTFMTHLGTITSPSCPCCSPPCRQHVQKTSEKHNPRANIVQDSPQDAQTPLSSLPEVPKTEENLRKQNFRIKIWISIQKCSIPIGNLYVSIEILIFYTKNCVFLKFFYGFKIIHFNFHLPYPSGPR